MDPRLHIGFKTNGSGYLAVTIFVVWFVGGDTSHVRQSKVPKTIRGVFGLRHHDMSNRPPLAPRGIQLFGV